MKRVMMMEQGKHIQWQWDTIFSSSSLFKENYRAHQDLDLKRNPRIGELLKFLGFLPY
jgi:hypothetical protein